MKRQGSAWLATQVDVHLRIIVIDISESKNKLQVFINPVVKTKTGTQEYEEGCLSVPGVYENVTRAETVLIEALDRNGKPFTLEADGLMAVCIQHEMDHLLGKVFVQYLSPLKQNRIKTKMQKRQRGR
jgi:peptide deformylase